MESMRFKVGDRVRIKSIDWYNENKNKRGNVPMGQFSFNFCNKHLCGTILTIRRVLGDYYLVKENDAYWTDEMIEGLVEEDNPFDDNIPLPDSFVERMVHKILDSELFNAEPLDIPTMTTDFVKEHGLPCPEGYIFKDENGNVINATKIVLEKKKKEVILTQEQIDTMVHDSCVLFCKHCGCGIPRDTCTSLGSCKDHDEYRKSMRTYFERHKN